MVTAILLCRRICIAKRGWILNDRYLDEPATQAYLDQIHALSALTGTGLYRPADSGSA